MTRCARCRTPGELEGATITDTGGAGFIYLCEPCKEIVEAVRCRMCGEPDPPRRRAEDLYFDSDVAEFHPGGEIQELPTYPVCDDCRKELIFNGGPA